MRVLAVLVFVAGLALMFWAHMISPDYVFQLVAGFLLGTAVHLWTRGREDS